MKVRKEGGRKRKFFQRSLAQASKKRNEIKNHHSNNRKKKAIKNKQTKRDEKGRRPCSRINELLRHILQQHRPCPRNLGSKSWGFV